jgi:hypothetical protein
MMSQRAFFSIISDDCVKINTKNIVLYRGHKGTKCNFIKT